VGVWGFHWGSAPCDGIVWGFGGSIGIPLGVPPHATVLADKSRRHTKKSSALDIFWDFWDFWDFFPKPRFGKKL